MGSPVIPDDEVIIDIPDDEVDISPQEPPTLSQRPQIQSDPKNAIESYLREAQPAFKWVVGGMPTDLKDIDRVSKGSWTDLYRQANLPGSKSTSTAGQLIPQAAGAAIDVATRPSTWVTAGVGPKIAKAAAMNPVTRRFLANQLPTLSKPLLNANPIEPVFKPIDGALVDVTKPLPKTPTRLVEQGQNLVSAVKKTIKGVRNEYETLLTPFYKNAVTKDELAGLPKGVVKELGINPSDATVEGLWKGRWTLLKRLNENTPYKEELLRKTRLSEDQLMNSVKRVKALVMNKLTPEAREKIDMLDPKFEEIMSAGRGVLRSVYDPKTKRINTKRLVGIFKDKSDEGTRRLFDRLAYFNKDVEKIAGNIQRYNTGEVLKKWAGRAIGLTALDQFLRWRLKQMTGLSSGGGSR